MKSSRKGWVRLHRMIQDDELHPSVEGRAFTKFEAKLDMIMLANYEPTTIKGIKIERGQFSHSYRFLAKRYKWSLGKVQRFIEHLIADKFLRRSDTQTGTLSDTLSDTPQNVLSICKYERYQSGDLENDTLSDTLSDTQTSTKKKKYNNKRNNIGIFERKKIFEEKCYSLNILNNDDKKDFIRYWTEVSDNGKKMKWEIHKSRGGTWQMEGRMRTWKSKGYNKKNDFKPIVEKKEPKEIYKKCSECHTTQKLDPGSNVAICTLCKEGMLLSKVEYLAMFPPKVEPKPVEVLSEEEQGYKDDVMSFIESFNQHKIEVKDEGEKDKKVRGTKNERKEVFDSFSLREIDFKTRR